MLAFVLSEGNFPFAVALGLMLGIAVLEGTMTLLGAGLSQSIDSLFPGSAEVDVDLDVDADMDMDADIDVAPGIDDINGAGADFGDAQIGHETVGSATALSRILGWFCVGKVPVLILLVIFLTVFGVSGLVAQSVAASVTGSLLPASLASIPALFVAVPSVRVFGKGLAKLIPKDETSAVARDSFVGRVATITVGTARSGQAAEAKLKDAHGQSHYVMVEPDMDEDAFPAGSKVLIVERRGSRFRIIQNTSSALVDD